ncbi:hypothetical protein BAY61_21000 [Prauserella marina]|uniref:PQQ-like domain-containing protein n=1 Tax=Prauserella marina TaxID=530584 RepID=A0A222VTK9_9PSEU|nr:PQQ-binding-like beta-propeller repeat protein [Prauserella marina]ASR37051.1 hypothetical protein BAY61_21000 [Prauserella marina]PWV79969.1 putative pyrroloquinoline-quinone binding quinoprotein [Prauserella marina]SDD85990.1 PQQ-like domain-containing protein [Prauserella marina]
MRSPSPSTGRAADGGRAAIWLSLLFCVGIGVVTGVVVIPKLLANEPLPGTAKPSDDFQPIEVSLLETIDTGDFFEAGSYRVADTGLRGDIAFGVFSDDDVAVLAATSPDSRVKWHKEFGHDGRSLSISVADSLVVTYDGGSLAVLDLETGAEKGTLKDIQPWLISGEHLVAREMESESLRVYDLQDLGSPPWTLAESPSGTSFEPDPTFPGEGLVKAQLDSESFWMTDQNTVDPGISNPLPAGAGGELLSHTAIHTGKTTVRDKVSGKVKADLALAKRPEDVLLADDSLYVLTGSGSTVEVAAYALAEPGLPAWRETFDTGARLGSSLRLCDGTTVCLLTQTRDHDLRTHAIDSTTGELRWEREQDDQVFRPLGATILVSATGETGFDVVDARTGEVTAPRRKVLGLGYPGKDRLVVVGVDKAVYLDTVTGASRLLSADAATLTTMPNRCVFGDSYLACATDDRFELYRYEP